MSWKTASEILVTDRGLRVRADSGVLNRAGVGGEGRNAFVFLYMNFIPLASCPVGAQPWGDTAPAWPLRGRTSDLQRCEHIRGHLSWSCGGVQRHGKARKMWGEFQTRLKGP